MNINVIGAIIGLINAVLIMVILSLWAEKKLIKEKPEHNYSNLKEEELKMKRGRPRGPSGKYRIEGKPVFEDIYQKWLSKQKLAERIKRKENIAEKFEERLSIFSITELEKLRKDTEEMIKSKKAQNKGFGINAGNEYKRCIKCDKVRLIRWYRIIEKDKLSDECLSCERKENKLQGYSDRKTGWIWEGNIPYIKNDIYSNVTPVTKVFK